MPLRRIGFTVNILKENSIKNFKENIILELMPNEVSMLKRWNLWNWMDRVSSSFIDNTIHRGSTCSKVLKMTSKYGSIPKGSPFL
jgi:hypothetical protein